tara:strand:+ start:2153 stop:2299 length:147 start_codon:yes stop_codon:yes gene_type:complete
MASPDLPLRDPEPDFMESYERDIDRQLADEEAAREDAGSADYLAGFLD